MSELFLYLFNFFELLLEISKFVLFPLLCFLQSLVQTIKFLSHGSKLSRSVPTLDCDDLLI